MTVFKRFILGLIAATLLLLAGCGQKGPLYMPDEDVQQNKQQTESTEQQ